MTDSKWCMYSLAILLLMWDERYIKNATISLTVLLYDTYVRASEVMQKPSPDMQCLTYGF